MIRHLSVMVIDRFRCNHCFYVCTLLSPSIVSSLVGSGVLLPEQDIEVNVTAAMLLVIHLYVLAGTKMLKHRRLQKYVVKE